MSFLELRAVSQEFASDAGPVLALQGLSFSVSKGEFVALLGPSGCGKSTCLRLIAGLEQPTAGRILLAGREVRGCGSEHEGDGARTLIFQRPSLFPWLTAAENVAFGLRIRGWGRRERLAAAHRALAEMGLATAANLFPHQLSGGMQQRVALARALILNPAVVLMDEPLSATDALLRSRLQLQIHQACVGRTVLFVTHSIREALVLADRILILTHQPGRVRREITPPGRPPRAPDAALLTLEREIEGELMEEVFESIRAPSGAGAPP
ncbi:MAG: ABC transporter ATP-binding protein [Chloroflexi bacterium]|nr:ABC transporter ATP-binding protein [Chloroflexota bacterium]